MRKTVSVILLVISVMLVRAQSLYITTDKTLSLVFPHPILHVDRGTPDVLAEGVKGADNVLLVKAALAAFKETSLSVVTADGSVHAFLLCYGEPAAFVHYIPPTGKPSVRDYAEALLDNGPHLGFKRAHRWGVEVAVWGLYVKEDILYLHLQLTNQSNLDYDTDLMRCSVKDNKTARKTAVQELELKPLHVAGDVRTIRAGSKTALVVALPRFTIPDGKHFEFTLTERSGGRHFRLIMTNRHLVRAIPLPDRP